jgi:hypothetical protein
MYSRKYENNMTENCISSIFPSVILFKKIVMCMYSLPIGRLLKTQSTVFEIGIEIHGYSSTSSIHASCMTEENNNNTNQYRCHRRSPPRRFAPLSKGGGGDIPRIFALWGESPTNIAPQGGRIS